jgi:3-deoxy-D-manno-octulosonic-acid transferase
VAEIIRARGFSCVRRSACVGATHASPLHEETAVILGDTMGELMAFYALGSVAFVGKSLVPPGGGQNMIEPASLGKAVVFGSHTSNFRETRDALISADAAREVAAEGLPEALSQLLSNQELRATLGARARAVVDASRGAVDRTLDILKEALDSSAKAG